MQPQNGFWKRQFSSEPSRAQNSFDVLIGEIAPVLCLIFDPFVFTGNRGSLLGSFLAPYRIFAYLAIGLGLLALTIWLTFGFRFKAGWSKFTAGVLISGAFFSGILGIILIPFSLLGLFMAGIGIFGFIPFVTGFVYLRNGMRAFRNHGENQKWLALSIFISGVLFTLAVPTLIQWQTSRVVTQGNQLISSGDPKMVEQGVVFLKGAFWCNDSCYDGVIDAYLSPQTSETQRIVLADSYSEITGKGIDNIIQQITQGD